MSIRTKQTRLVLRRFDLRYVFDVYTTDVKGIVEVEAKDDQDAIAKVNKLGLKFNHMREHICIYKIQYAPSKKSYI